MNYSHIKAATRVILYKKLFLEILQYSQENTCMCWSAYTKLDFFLLLTYSCLQNSWSY